MKYIKLNAYFATNLGDDLMVNILLKKFPEHIFYAEGDMQNTAQFYKNNNFRDKEYYYLKYGRLGHVLDILTFNRFKGWLFKYIFSSIKRKCCCSVYIGGSLYMQQNDITNEQVSNRIIREERLLEDGPLFVIGANFGAYSSEYYRESFEKYFQKCAGVSFRDTLSKEMFRHLSNIQYAPDVVFSIDDIPIKNINTNKVLISVIDAETKFNLKKYRQSYEQFISDFCKYVVDNGKTPILMSFCKKEGDENAIQRIESLTGDYSKYIEKYFYRGNIEEALQIIANAELILASRFHAMILALRFNKKFFAISYDDKITNVLQDVSSDLFCDISEVDNITPVKIFELADNVSNIDNYINMAHNQFFQLKQYLDEEK